MWASSREKNVYSLEDISPGLSLIVGSRYIEFMKEGDNGFYFAYRNIGQFLSKIDGTIFTDSETVDDDPISIDIQDYADIFREMFGEKNEK